MPAVTFDPSASVDPVEFWARCHREAEALAPASGAGRGKIAALRWVDAKCAAAGLPRLSPWWRGAFETFFDSEKIVCLVRAGLRSGKSYSTCRPVIADMLFQSRVLPRGEDGVCPVVSASKEEANNRFGNLKEVLLACGIREATKESEKADKTRFSATGSSVGGGEIVYYDFEGHRVVLRVKPATLTGLAGFTGVAGFCDEIDLWKGEGSVNPATQVFDIALSRFSTQPAARLFVISASYQKYSLHAALIEKGSTPLVHVATLGQDGANLDNLKRLELAAILADKNMLDRKAADLLFANADPTSPDIPAWVSNPTVDMWQCFLQSKLDVENMLVRNGGRRSKWDSRAGRGIERALIDDDFVAAARRLGGEEDGLGKQWPGLSAEDPRSTRYRGGRGGDDAL